MARLKDLTLWRWHVFAGSPPSRAAADEQTEGWQDFAAALDAAARWAGAAPPAASVTAELRAAAPARRSSLRLATQPWRETDGLLRCFEARALLDGFYIESGCALEGMADAEAVRRLQAADWRWPAGDPAFLGGAVCLTAECRPTLADGEAGETIGELLRAWFAGPDPQFEIVELTCGRLAIPAGADDDEAWVLLVGDEDLARRQAAHLLHRLVPPLLLARLKGRALMQALERDLLPKASEQQVQLEAECRRFAARRPRLADLERSSGEIARLQAAFAETLARGNEIAETLQVNAANVERLLKDPLLEGGAMLDTLLAAPLRLGAGQLSTDLRYLTITEAQADRTQRSIETMAQLRVGRWGRWITVLLGGFGAFELLQVFPELPLGWRVGASVVLPLVLVFILLALGRGGKA